MALFHRATITPTKAELIAVFRRPAPGPRPAIGLTATWDGQDDPVILAEVRER